MTEKQYENLMFMMSMIFAAIIDNKPLLPSGRKSDEMNFITALYTGEEAKEVYDFIQMANSFEGDNETLKEKIG